MRLTIKHRGEPEVAMGGKKLNPQVQQQMPLCRDGTTSEGCQGQLGTETASVAHTFEPGKTSIAI